VTRYRGYSTAAMWTDESRAQGAFELLHAPIVPCRAAAA
jgi:hypothetical protein